MALVPVTELVAGQVLGADLCAADGQCLLAAGSVLDERVIAMLMLRGIDAVPVADANEPAAEREQLRDLLRERTARRFRNEAGHPLMQALHRSALEFLLKANGLDG
jgi:hypothetical protein